MQLVMNLRFALATLLVACISEEVAAHEFGAGIYQLRKSGQRYSALHLEQHRSAQPALSVQPKTHKQRVMDYISKFRAGICAKMIKEHKQAFRTYEACEKYMYDACKPGKDKSMDGDKREMTSQEGYCTRFFPEAEKEAEEEVSKQEQMEAEDIYKVASSPGPAPGPGPGPAPSSAPAPAVAKETKAPAPAPAAAGKAPVAAPAPAPGPMGAPGPAPVPAPFIPGLSAGKPWGPIAADEAYYYKAGGKDAMRLHMDEGSKLPDQGYWGKLVEHDDGKTATGDWGHEFGPKSGHESFESVCREHPENPWCYRQGLGRHKSFSPAHSVHYLLLVLVLVFY